MYITIILMLLVILYCVKNYQFKQTTYYQVTHNSYLATKLNLGRNGEFLTYLYLKDYEASGGRFLFNCYLPKENGETTEIDVLLICKDGIYVFESKNYSGWIFGYEKSKTWTQTLPQGRGRSHKEHFLNPIMQNKLHIKWLKSIVGDTMPIHSVIVFSERCTLKQVTVDSPDIFAINRNHIKRTVQDISNRQSFQISSIQIEQLYNKLFPYTQVTEEQKVQHVMDIQTNHSKATVKHESNTSKMPQSDYGICPRCGSKIVLRTTKSGPNAGRQFYGCSSFPKCRYMKNL